MKKPIAFIICILICTLNAQTTLMHYGGPAIPDFSNSYTRNILMGDDEDSFSVYCTPIGRKNKHNHHEIHTYNKKSNHISTQKIDLPGRYWCMWAHDIGAYSFATYVNYEKSNTFQYSTATIPKGNASTTVTPTTRLTLNVDASGAVFSYYATSPNKKYHAVILESLNKKDVIEGFYIFVYNANCDEVYSQNVLPQMYGGHFSFEDFQVDDEGTAILLICGKEAKGSKVLSSAIQVVTCDSHGSQSFGQTTNFGAVESMKLLPLKNGNYFIGGYYYDGMKSPTIGYFSTLFDPKEKEFSELTFERIPEEKRPKKQVFNFIYPVQSNTQCRSLYELNSGEVVMVGEYYGQLAIRDNNMTTYKNYTHDAIYQKFDKEGKPLYSHNVDKRAGSNADYFASFDENNYTYNGLGVASSTFCDGENVWMLYTDTQKHFNGSGKEEMADVLMWRGKNCLVLANLTDNGPKLQLAAMPNKEKTTFNSLWNFDGNNVYFGMHNLKNFFVEHFSVK